MDSKLTETDLFIICRSKQPPPSPNMDWVCVGLGRNRSPRTSHDPLPSTAKEARRMIAISWFFSQTGAIHQNDSTSHAIPKKYNQYPPTGFLGHVRMYASCDYNAMNKTRYYGCAIDLTQTLFLRFVIRLRRQSIWVIHALNFILHFFPLNHLLVRPFSQRAHDLHPDLDLNISKWNWTNFSFESRKNVRGVIWYDGGDVIVQDGQSAWGVISKRILSFFFSFSNKRFTQACDSLGLRDVKHPNNPIINKMPASSRVRSHGCTKVILDKVNFLTSSVSWE